MDWFFGLSPKNVVLAEAETNQYAAIEKGLFKKVTDLDTLTNGDRVVIVIYSEVFQCFGRNAASARFTNKNLNFSNNKRFVGIENSEAVAFQLYKVADEDSYCYEFCISCTMTSSNAYNIN